jgi:hypothetical protein
MKNLALPLLMALMLVGGCGSSTSGDAAAPASTEPKFTDIVLTDSEDDKPPKSEFKTDTAKIWVFFGLENVKTGSKIKGVWICEKAPDIPPDFKIDEASVDIGMIDNMGNFSLSKPNNGWPVGDYRVELYVDDKKLDERKFKIAQ